MMSLNNPKTENQQSIETLNVLERHLTAFRLGDVDLTLQDYAADAIIINGTGEIVRGTSQIHETFISVYRDYFPEGTRDIEIDEKTICGEVAYIRWRASNAKLATDTIIVRNGKIVAQTFAAYF
ncbi:snoaL-like domain protein [Acinetobacter sp. 25977_6]|uniref:Nuclear transport factor 2 family protein n=1 Tax=Acinetobacter nosocomialis TaxID=106654 RepID=A0AB36LXC0_ACINO|nr:MULTISPECIES: nuclear transport factor 2 family protein [Acinetobacter calcoaceticus/baumannii complex]KCZ32610.1 snoaL-like domain protein [Acinetobacter baumannii 25977_9]EXB70748.1 snoaL-like domain protein [Acinetobacter sp. 21871]EXR66022.1 snoaL-like domain protein [Acinetobacter sp. 1424608]EXT37443.1 snoaL-like domain protein [Acinetobacter sp. 25977_8]EXT47403.1 snoaL-like domain protein [Acinetobacter sp. 25977_7]